MVVNPKIALYSAIVAGGAISPAAILNGQILEIDCDGQMRVGCQGLPPTQHHVEQREPAPPLLGANAVYALTTGSAPSHTGWGAMVSGPSGVAGFGGVTPPC